jgi:hypothetical protein
MNKLIAIINNISVVDNKSCLLKTTINKYYLIEVQESDHVLVNNVGESLQWYLKKSELLLWGTDDLQIFSIRCFYLGKEKIIFNSSTFKIKEISSGKALTLLLKE